MNVLSHVRVTLDLINKCNIDEDHNLLLIGSVLPDLAEAGLIDHKMAHYNGEDFIRYLEKYYPTMKSLGVGFALHGESPRGLDYYSHIEDPFVINNQHKVLELFDKLNVRVPQQYHRYVSHFLLEFAVDSHLDKFTARRLNLAFKKVKTSKIANVVSKFFKADYFKLYFTLKLIKAFNFERLVSPKGVFTVFKYFVKHNKGDAKLQLLHDKDKNLSKVMKDKNMISVMYEVRDILEDDYFDFLERTTEKMKNGIIQDLYSKRLIKLKDRKN